jgi:uncharacterized protein (AIM24 family)
MKAHQVDYQIVGDDIQMVLVELDPGETVIAEAGAMNYMEEGNAFEPTVEYDIERAGNLKSMFLGALGRMFEDR